MKTISHKVFEVSEIAYNTQEECDKHVKKMIKSGFRVEHDYDDIFLYYRKFVKASCAK